MNETNLSPATEPYPDPIADHPVREPDPKLTPKAQAKAANKLPKAEQLDKFEQSLEAHDPGNQPA
jgi:hypothetical protein